MKLPRNASAVTLDLEWKFEHTYPPLGFLPFPGYELGNGDRFGLYWPIGREDQEPLVMETEHDARALCPAFSSLDALLRKAGSSDDWVEPPTLEEDPDSPLACFEAWQVATCASLGLDRTLSTK